MPFAYVQSGTTELRQGEMVGPVVEHRTRHPATLREEGVEITFDTIQHPKMIVLTAECDLLSDYKLRSSGEEVEIYDGLQHVLLCDVFTEDEVLAVYPEGFGSKERRAVKQNQNERYHRFPAALIGETGTEHPDLYIDFRQCIGVPPAALYQGLDSGQILRLGRLPDVYLQDLTHRFYGFCSRVGPDF